MRLQTLYLPSVGPDQRLPFALVLDQVDEDLSPQEVEAVHRFGRDVGAAGVLITGVTVDIPAELEVAADPAPTTETFVDIDPGPLGVAVAQAVRTHLETQGGTLRGLR